jgi:hypothetical protein
LDLELDLRGSAGHDGQRRRSPDAKTWAQSRALVTRSRPPTRLPVVPPVLPVAVGPIRDPAEVADAKLLPAPTACVGLANGLANRSSAVRATLTLLKLCAGHVVRDLTKVSSLIELCSRRRELHAKQFVPHLRTRLGVLAVQRSEPTVAKRCGLGAISPRCIPQ